MMTNNFHLPFVFLLLASGIIIGGATLSTNGDNGCTAELGECGQLGDCDQRCKQAHPMGNGQCNLGLCICYYTCQPPAPPSPPEHKRCNVNGGVCGRRSCGDECCKGMCQAKWPGADGLCQNVIGTSVSLCLCTYDC